MDSFFLDRAVARDGGVDEDDRRIRTTKGIFVYGDQKPHCWSGPGTSGDRIREMAEYGLRKKPAGTTTPWWKY